MFISCVLVKTDALVNLIWIKLLGVIIVLLNFTPTGLIFEVPKALISEEIGIIYSKIIPQ